MTARETPVPTRKGHKVAAPLLRLGPVLLLVFCAAITVLSAVGATRLTYEAEFIAIVDRPVPDDGSPVTETLNLWQDPPLSLLLTWRGVEVAGMAPAISDLVFDLNFEPGVEQVVSVFSPTLPGTRTNPLDAALETGGDIGAALASLRSETLLGSSFLSEDFRSSLIQVQGGDPLALTARFATCAEGAPLCVQAIGSKAIETTIQGALRTENAFLPGLSAALCVLALWLWFGSLRRALLLMVPPMAGCLWYFGMMGFAGLPFDPFNAVIPTVIMTLGTADMLHLQRARDLVPDAPRARVAALRAVLPAVTITTFTTAVAFGSLYFEGSALLERLGISGVLGVAILWSSVVLLGPFCVGAAGRASRLQLWTQGPLHRAVIGAVSERLGLLRALAVVTGLAGLAIALTASSNFTFHENIPASDTARAFDDATEAGLALAPIFFTLTPDDRAAAGATIAALYGLSDADPAQFAELETDGGAFVLPFAIPFGASAQDIQAEKSRVAALLAKAGAVTISGYPSHVSATVLSIITNLQIILFACFALHALVIGAMMRSARIALATFIPNALPIFAIYLFMTQTVGWIDVSAAVAMILVSGLAVDDTTHILWAGRGGRGRGKPFSIIRGLDRAFEPVFITSIVLAMGFGPLMLSTLPGLQTLGALMILALIVAWVADVLLLPALFRRDARETA